MSKVITFSRTFPSYHPRKGEPTRFVEQILNSLKDQDVFLDFAKIDASLGWSLLDKFGLIGRKHHTIRGGHRFKVGDWFSPRVWSGKPYKSKQITIAPDIQIKKIWDFEIDPAGVYSINGKYLLNGAIELRLAKNDGFDNPADMFNWFMVNYSKPKPFEGQIICWNDTISY